MARSRAKKAKPPPATATTALSSASWVLAAAAAVVAVAAAVLSSSANVAPPPRLPSRTGYAVAATLTLQNAGGAGDAGSGGSADARAVLLTHKDFGARSRRLYRASDGRPVRRLREARNGTAYVSVDVAVGEHFIYPSRPLGRLQPIADVRVPGARRPASIEQLSESPRVFLVHDFVAEAEADALKAKALDPSNPWKIQRSTTGHESWSDSNEGREEVASTRTSMNGFDVDSPTAMAIKRRVFSLLRVEAYDEQLADGIQVLRYRLRNAYIPHNDYFEKDTSADFNWNPQTGGSNRFATVFLYLSDDFEGGQTVFPRATNRTGVKPPRQASALFKAGSWESEMVEQCYGNLAVRPKKGNALLFYSQNADLTLDENSIHGGCPVLKGEKWAANVWVWNRCRFGQCQNMPPAETRDETPRMI